MSRSPRRTLKKASGSAARVVLRRCRVCEWQDEVVETAGADPDCPWCHGPTLPVIDTPATIDEHSLAGKNPHAAALGRLGGMKGGRARAETLSAKRRREIASQAAHARWDKRDKKPDD